MDQLTRDVLLNTLERFDKYFDLANLKASLLVTTNAILMVSILGIDDKTVAALSLTFTPLVAKLLLPGTLVIFAASAIACLAAVWAVLDTGAKPGKYRSLLFFGSIKELDFEVFREKIMKIQAEEYNDDLAHQVHLLSEVLMRKYKYLNFGSALLGLGLTLSAILGTVAFWN